MSDLAFSPEREKRERDSGKEAREEGTEKEEKKKRGTASSTDRRQKGDRQTLTEAGTSRASTKRGGIGADVDCRSHASRCFMRSERHSSGFSLDSCRKKEQKETEGE